MRGADDPGPATAAWWARKRAELAYLATFAAAPPPSLPDTAPQDPVAALLRANSAMRQTLRVEAATAGAGLYETAQDPPGARTYQVGGARIAYAYQRYDLALSDQDWLRRIHGREAPGRARGGLLLSSGMSAITAVLATFGVLGIGSVSISPWCYFETHLLLQTFFPGVQVATADGAAFHTGAEVAWLDTSSTRWPSFPTERGRLRLLVVDTSCVEAGSDLVADWLDAGRRLGIPVALVRSHLKLDTFGIEKGRLGSVVVVAPDADPDEHAIGPWLSGLRRAMAWMGLGFELTNLHPWLGEPAFLELSRLRTEGIRVTTDAIADAVEAARQPGDGFHVVRPPHRLFLRVRTGIAFRHPDTWRRHELAYDLAADLAGLGQPVFAGSSFGMDRVALNQFIDVRDGDHHLRISGADLPPGALPDFGRRVRDAIARLTARERAAGGTEVEDTD